MSFIVNFIFLWLVIILLNEYVTSCYVQYLDTVSFTKGSAFACEKLCHLSRKEQAKENRVGTGDWISQITAVKVEVVVAMVFAGNCTAIADNVIFVYWPFLLDFCDLVRCHRPSLLVVL